MPKTIQLQNETYRALRAYKVGGMTFDDVVRRLMDNKDTAEFHAEYRRWQREVLEAAQRSSDFHELD